MPRILNEFHQRTFMFCILDIPTDDATTGSRFLLH
jgi:hypothetical protein